MQIVALLSSYAHNRCFTPQAITRLKSLGDYHEVIDIGRRETDNALVADAIKNADILVTGWGTPRLTADILAAAKQLKLIAYAAGSVSFIDIAAWKRGITVTNVMPIMAMGVAEFTVTCILSGLRRFDALLNPAKFDANPFFSVPKVGFMLRGKTVGMVGLGIIGRQTLDLLRPFGCNFQVYDPFINEQAIRALGATKVDLESLMSTSDIVSLHAPGTKKTEHIINEPMLRRLKPGAILVNTARGILIDNDALVAVAKEGKIGVYLDVTRPERLPDDHPLRHMNNVVITPHIAGPTVEGWPMMGDACVDEVERYIKGEPVKYPVLEHQYENQST